MTVEPSKDEIEKRIATMGDPKSNGAWKAFVARNKRAEMTAGPNKDQINTLANNIVDKNYQQKRNKPPFTQMAENAVKELSFKMKDGFIENNAGNHRLDNVKEAIEMNEALDKNFRDHKTDDYLKMAKLPPKKSVNYLSDNYSFAENFKKQSKNINNKPSRAVPAKLNPTVNRYKAFKENKKMEEEEKQFKKGYEKEYGEQAIKDYVRGKVNKNRKEGKKDYENLSTSDIIVSEYTREEAKEKLKALKTIPIKSGPTYIDYRLTLKDPEPAISLEEHLAKTAPREAEPPGITGLEEVKDFRNTIDMAAQRFPQKARGIGPFISGEDD